MIFSLAIYATPSSQAGESAYRFAEALLSQGHTLYRVFFYHDGVYHANALNCPPQGEADLTQRWRDLFNQYDIDGVVCIAAALRRGILDDTEASRYEKPASNVMPEVALSGLGQLIDAAVQSDRLITFGG